MKTCANLQDTRRAVFFLNTQPTRRALRVVGCVFGFGFEFGFGFDLGLDSIGSCVGFGALGVRVQSVKFAF